MSLTAVLRCMQFDDITVHGSRSSFRDWRAEAAANTFSREVCEHALAHRLPDREPTPMARRSFRLMWLADVDTDLFLRQRDTVVVNPSRTLR